MFKLSAKIEIKGSRTWVFENITACEIVRDMEALTNTATLTLPYKTQWKGETSNPIKRGDAITIWLGYDDDLQLAFKGYVTQKGLKAPLVIKCEDEMFMLKQTPAVKKSYDKATIETILKDQSLQYTIKVFGEQNIGRYRVNVETVAELLGHLKENNIRSFFKVTEAEVPTLCCGVLFDHDGELKQVFSTGINIISDEELEVQNSEDVKIKLKVISLMPDNKSKIRVEVGDNGGERRTLHCYNKSESEAKAWGEQELSRLKRSGLSGNFTTFGACFVDCMDVIGIIINGEKKGKYQVQKNIINYGVGGIRQVITLGTRIS